MKKMTKFGVKFEDSSNTPFFQVSPDHRIRFRTDMFTNKHFRLLRNIVDDIFEGDQGIHASFISGYILNNKRYSEKTGIGKFVKIKNWKETIIEDEDLQSKVIYTSIENLDKIGVYKYCHKVAQGHKEAYISFYNDNYLLYVSTDVFDIISHDHNLIQKLKNKYSNVYEKDYDDNDI